MPDPFISRDDLSDYIGRDVTADDGALMAIDAACEICRLHAEQQFNAGTATESYDGTGTDAILLRRLPVTNAGSVTVNGTAEADFEFTSNGLLLRGTAGSNPRPAWPAGRQNISVTYEHGYSDIPRDVRRVALEIAARTVVQGVAQFETLGDVSVRYGTNSTDLTNGEKAILAKYRQLR